MAKLNPLGSEKLTGQEKLNRIMEIARYREVPKEETNGVSTTEYSINVSDGNQYQIVKEKTGYVIKKNISESTVDYIEPMRNRKYYNSYSQALKRLNLIVKESNRVNGQDEEISLFGEQKKFVLKKPESAMDEPMSDENMVPSEPPSVPQPPLPDSPESMPAADDMEIPTDEIPMDNMPSDEMPTDDMGSTPSDSEMVTFKSIQKLTGKLTQKIREYEQEKGLTSENIKYVLNMVISAVDLEQLSDEDKEDVLSKFESDEDFEDGGDMDMGDMDTEDITGDSEVEDVQADMDIAVDQEMGESSLHDTIMDGIFGESKIDKLISNYFELSESEKNHRKEVKINEGIKRRADYLKKVKSIENLSESIEQELSSKKFLQENQTYIFLGKTNKKNLVFENKSGQIKISPDGFVI